jgi:glycosyltransferase involved in cell wall biosynthesis
MRYTLQADANLAKKKEMIRIVFLTATLTQYRLPFHEGVRRRLARRGMQYDVIYGQPSRAEASKRDLTGLRWGKQIVNRSLTVGDVSVVWQPALKDLWASDLVVIGQENRLLLNYVIQSVPGAWRPKVALWGHGRNFQADPGQGLREWWKRRWATRCDWWFAYTEQTREIVQAYGFPAERITVLNNAVDSSEIEGLSHEITEHDLGALRRQLGISTDNVGVYVGGIYNHKRIDFLIQSAVEIRRRIPDFAFIVIGSGDERGQLEAAARSYCWLHYLGPRFGREKVEVLKLGRAFMMPGLVGLAVLDCAAAGIPIVTTAYPYHSPEIEYLRVGGNGLIVDDWRSVGAYAEAVVLVLQDAGLRAQFSKAGMEMAKRYTMDRMVDSFCAGVSQALAN